MSKIFIGTLNRLYKTIRTVEGSFRWTGILTRSLIRNVAIEGSFRYVGVLSRLNHAIRTLAGSLIFSGTLIASYTGGGTFRTVIGTFHCLGSLARSFRASKTLTASFHLLGTLSANFLGAFLRSGSGNLRMSGKVYILRETLYYGIANP